MVFNVLRIDPYWRVRRCASSWEQILEQVALGDVQRGKGRGEGHIVLGKVHSIRMKVMATTTRQDALHNEDA